MILCHRMVSNLTATVRSALQLLAYMGSTEYVASTTLSAQVQALRVDVLSARLPMPMALDHTVPCDLLAGRIKKLLEILSEDQASVGDLITYLSWLCSLAPVFDARGRSMTAHEFWLNRIQTALASPCRPCYKFGQEGCQDEAGCRFCHDDRHWRVVTRTGRAACRKVYGRTKPRPRNPGDGNGNGGELCIISRH